MSDGDVVYGRQPVREALRGRRGVLEVLATAKAHESLPWLETYLNESRSFLLQAWS